MDQLNLSENVDTLFRSLESFTQKEGVIGKPVTQGERTFLPVVSVTIGYGGGNMSAGKGAQSGGSMPAQSTPAGSLAAGSGALGLGAKLSTEAVILIDSKNVSMIPMSAAGTSQLVDKIPQIVSGLGQGKMPGQSQGQAGQSQGQAGQAGQSGQTGQAGGSAQGSASQSGTPWSSQGTSGAGK